MITWFVPRTPSIPSEAIGQTRAQPACSYSALDKRFYTATVTKDTKRRTARHPLSLPWLGPKRILRHLDPVSLEPRLVLGLRFGQSRRLGEAVLLRLRSEQLDHAGHV